MATNRSCVTPTVKNTDKVKNTDDNGWETFGNIIVSTLLLKLKFCSITLSILKNKKNVSTMKKELLRNVENY